MTTTTTMMMRRQPAWIGVTWWMRTRCPYRDPFHSTWREVGPWGQWSRACLWVRREPEDPPSPTGCLWRIGGWEGTDPRPPPSC